MKENVSRRGKIPSRLVSSEPRLGRLTASTIAEKHGTKYLICGRAELAPDETYFSLRTATTVITELTFIAAVGRRSRDSRDF